jgi:hypothetical protein
VNSSTNERAWSGEQRALSYCCVQDLELEQLHLIRLKREQAEAQKIGLELQLMALEVQRRQALLAASTMTLRIGNDSQEGRRLKGSEWRFVCTPVLPEVTFVGQLSARL